VIKQNPLNLSARKRRLEHALNHIGVFHNINLNAIERGLATGYQFNSSNIMDDMSKATTELLSCVVVNENNIAVSRNHLDTLARYPARTGQTGQTGQDVLDYTSIFPPTPKAATDMEIHLPALLQTRDEFDDQTLPNINPDNRVNNPEQVQMQIPLDPVSSSSSMEKSFVASDQPAESAAGDGSKSIVPKVPYWDRVFYAPNQASILYPNIQSTEIQSSPRSTCAQGNSSTQGNSSATNSRWSPVPPQRSDRSSNSWKQTTTNQSPRTARMIIHEASQTHYLPIHRPFPTATKIDQPENEPEYNSSTNNNSKKFNQFPNDVYLIKSPRDRPKSNYSALVQENQEEDEYRTQNYESYYRGGYLSRNEAKARELQQKKRYFLAGEFKTHFNAHNSVISRPEAFIRSNGPYPAAPVFGHSPEVKALEWTFMKHETIEDKQKWIAGAWK
jgi:hypothetical protein